MSYSITQIATVTKAVILQQKNDAAIAHLLLDSRKLLFPAASLFFALNGPRRNGGQFIKELYNKGVRNFIVEEGFDTGELPAYPEANFLQVKQVLTALQDVAAYHRMQFNLPVAGITGSNGKTIVKEWLYQLLQDDYAIVRSPKSYNSQIGVPLSVWQINAAHTLGIFEAGISQPGEMLQLEKVIRPEIGVFTNIGQAHSEGFLNIRQKINEKLQLFLHSKVLVYGADDADVNEAVNTFKNNVRPGNDLRLFGWSRNAGTALHIQAIDKQADRTVITAGYGTATLAFTILFTDDAAIENAITCCCVLLCMAIAPDKIAAHMQRLRSIEMRLELKQGINNCSVINDSYSADINSLAIALDFLQQQQQHQKRTLILSDILQSGETGKALYEKVAAIVQQKNINRFIGIGPQLVNEQAAFKAIPQTAFFSSTAAFKESFAALHFHDETILLKGARLFEFEQISHLLEQKMHQTVLEINLDAITHNLAVYQQQLRPGVKLMAMVKAFSYGSGGFEIANLLQFHKVDYLAVAYADEGVELRKAGITLPIMVMNAEESTFDVLVQYNLEPELYSFGILNAFENYLQRYAISFYPVHIKLDTGMHRLGFVPADMEAVCHKLKTTTAFKVQSVFSHLAASDSAEHDGFTAQQAALFVQGSTQLQNALDYTFIKHIANTAAIHRHPALQFDMVRLGIGLYGVDSHAGIQQLLQNVTTLKTTISQIKKIKAGDSIGYSRKGVAHQDSVIATVRIGYADGYPRMLSNGTGSMWVNGQLAPVIGSVCMDMTMLDITGIPAGEGDEVIVFGKQLPVSEVAKWSQTISYEILTGISQRVKRVYFEE